MPHLYRWILPIILTYLGIAVPAPAPQGWQSISGPGFVLHLPKDWVRTTAGDQATASTLVFAANSSDGAPYVLVRMVEKGQYDLSDLNVRRRMETAFRPAIESTLPHSHRPLRHSLTDSIYDPLRRRLWYRMVAEMPAGYPTQLGLFALISTKKGILHVEGHGVAGDEGFEEIFQNAVNSLELDATLRFQKPYFWLAHVSDYLSAESVLRPHEKLLLAGSVIFFIPFLLACLGLVLFNWLDLLFRHGLKARLIHRVLHLPVRQFVKDREVLAENRPWRAPLPWSLGLQLALTPVVVLMAPRYLHTPQLYGPVFLAPCYLLCYSLWALMLVCHYIPNSSRRLKYELAAAGATFLAIPGTLGDPVSHAAILGKDGAFINGYFAGNFLSQTIYFVVAGLAVKVLLNAHGNAGVRRVARLYRFTYRVKGGLLGMIVFAPLLLAGGYFGLAFVILVVLYQVGQKALEHPILYLRSFHDHDTSVVLAKLVMPTAGRLAPVLATAHARQPPEELYRRTNVLTTSRVTVLPDAAWRDWLLSALPRCRAALIDVSVGSEGVLWELEQAKVILPPTRFMVLAQGKVPPPTLDLTDVTVVPYQLGWRGRFRARKALRSWLKRACTNC
jgi:hypothetical protein